MTDLVFPDYHWLLRIVLSVEPHVVNGVLISLAIIKCHNLSEQIRMTSIVWLASKLWQVVHSGSNRVHFIDMYPW